MKKQNLFPILLLCAFSQFLASCVSNRNPDFASRKYFNYSLSENPVDKNQINSINENPAGESNNFFLKSGNKITEKTFEDITAELPSAQNCNTMDNPVSDAIPAADKSLHKKISKKLSRIILPTNLQSELPAQQNSEKTLKILLDPDPSDRLILEVILSVFIPPLAVYLHQDSITDFFWIDLLLTILFWFPGIIFALLVVLDVIN